MNSVYAISGICDGDNLYSLFNSTYNSEEFIEDDHDGSRYEIIQNADGSVIGSLYDNENMISYQGAFVNKQKAGFGILYHYEKPTYIGFFWENQRNGYGITNDFNGTFMQFDFWMNDHPVESSVVLASKEDIQQCYSSTKNIICTSATAFLPDQIIKQAPVITSITLDFSLFSQINCSFTQFTHLEELYCKDGFASENSRCNQLLLQDLQHLKKVSFGDVCLTTIQRLVVKNCPVLSELIIGTNNPNEPKVFAFHQCRQFLFESEFFCFFSIDLPMLQNLRIGNYVGYRTECVIFSDLPQLKSISIGLNSLSDKTASSVGFNLYLKNLPKLDIFDAMPNSLLNCKALFMNSQLFTQC